MTQIQTTEEESKCSAFITFAELDIMCLCVFSECWMLSKATLYLVHKGPRDLRLSQYLNDLI